MSNRVFKISIIQFICISIHYTPLRNCQINVFAYTSTEAFNTYTSSEGFNKYISTEAFNTYTSSEGFNKYVGGGGGGGSNSECTTESV